MNSDILILGAGPTGCALGIYLRKRGATVRLVEAIERPESVVGESMLPCSTEVFEDCGLDLSGFMVKRGAVFCENGRSVRYDFSEAETPRYTTAWQVQREVFDLRWRAAAQAAGCEITYAKATDVDIASRTLHTTAGSFRASRIVDAGGRAMWLSSKLGLREGDRALRNSAIGARFRGVKYVDPEQVGDITICCIPGGWIWVIPFGGDVASIGVVMAPDCPLKGSPEERFQGALALSPDLRERVVSAERFLPWRGLQDFTATSKTFSGEGFALCGDAATFIDPVFSSGVLLGLKGAKSLAAALDDGGDLAEYEATYRDGASVFRKVIDHWYAGDFMTLALAPAEMQKPYFRRGITTLLAGDVWRTGPTAARTMAERMPGLAKLVRENAAPPA